MSLALDSLNNGSRGRKSLGLTIPPSVLGRTCVQRVGQTVQASYAFQAGVK